MTPAADAVREAIAEYRVFDDPLPLDLQEVVHVAATVCGVPTAVINILDEHAQHQIAAVGLDPASCAREDSMCAIALHEPGRTVVADASADPRFAANPFVTGEIASVRFYASSPLVTPAGVVLGTLCVFDGYPGELTVEQGRALDALARQIVDILELRRLGRALRSSNEQLERFAAQVSHDLRNPLMALTGFLELASDSPEMSDAPLASQALVRAGAAATRMSALVTDLLDYARLGGARPRRQRVPFAATVAAVLDDLAASIASSRAVVEQDADIVLEGDPTLLAALVQNLVSNAIKFAAAAQVRPRVVVRAEQLPELWRISVEDNGPGVPLTDRESVFGLMERGSTQEPSGLGIGLSTCRRIVEAHGGLIGIEDSELGGATVWVQLPRPS